MSSQSGIEEMKVPAWIGVDLDGTLAHYTGWHADGSVGEPIPRMVERVKEWLAEGKEVRIVTARAYKDVPGGMPVLDRLQVAIVGDWCVKHLGARLKVQFWKDYAMTELWDDRAKQVIVNSGVLVEEIEQLAGLDSFQNSVRLTNDLFRAKQSARSAIHRAIKVLEALEAALPNEQ